MKLPRLKCLRCGMEITKEWLSKKGGCGEGVVWFENQKETDGIKLVEALMTENKLAWANWLIVRIMEYPQFVSYAVYAAEQVVEIYEKKYPDDERPRKAIEAAKKCIENPREENKADAVVAAYAAVYAAAYAVYAVVAAAYASVYAAYAAYAADAADAAASAYVAVASAYAASAYEMRLKILNYGLSLLEGDK